MHDPARAKYPFASMTEVLMRAMQHTKQKEDENLIDYVTRFKSAKNVLKSHVGSEVLHKFVEHTKEHWNEKNLIKKQEMKNESFDKWMACLLMRNSDQKKHGSLLEGLSTQYSMNDNQYPTTITKATDILANHKHDNADNKRQSSYKKPQDKTNGDDKNEGPKEQSFAQADKIVCCCCGKPSHKSPDCSEKDKIPKGEWFQKKACNNCVKAMTAESSKQENEESQLQATSKWNGLHLGASFHHCDFSQQAEALGEMKDHVILNNGSSLDLFGNEALMENVHRSKNKLILAANAGTKENNMKAHVQSYGNVWCDQDVIANTLSFANMKKKYWITYDSDKEDAFKVHMNGKILEFKETPQGLHCCSISKDYLEKIKKAKQKNQETSNMMDTVQENRKNYTQHQFKHAKLARKLHHNVGTPTVKNFKSLLKANMIKNCPVTIEDVNIAEKTFGPSMSSLKGKSARRMLKPVRADVIETPPKLIKQHHESMDTMFINQEAMLTAVDYTVKF